MFSSPSVIKFEFLSPQFVNFFEFEIFRVPALWRLVRQAPSGAFIPVYTNDNEEVQGRISGDPQLVNQLLVGAVPESVSGARGSRQTVRVEFETTQTTAIHLEIQRDWSSGMFDPGQMFPLGVQNARFKLVVNNREQLPKNFGQDTLVSLTRTSPLGFAERFLNRDHFAVNATNPSSTGTWLSEPQPVGESVVNFYMDVRTPSHQPSEMDGLVIEALTPGVTANLYYSNDDTPTLDPPLLSRRVDTVTTPEPPEFLSSLETESRYWRWGRQVPTPKGLLFDSVNQGINIPSLHWSNLKLREGWSAGLLVSSLNGNNSGDSLREYWRVENSEGVPMRLVFNRSNSSFELRYGSEVLVQTVATFQAYNQFALVWGYVASGPKVGYYLYHSAIRSSNYQLGWLNNQRVREEWQSLQLGGGTPVSSESAKAALSMVWVREDDFSLEVAQYFSNNPEQFAQMSGTLSRTRGDYKCVLFMRLIENLDINWNFDYTPYKDKLWTPVLSNFKLRSGKVTFPPILAKYLKLEFTNLLPRACRPTNFPVRYQVFPEDTYNWFTWVNSSRQPSLTVVDKPTFFESTDVNLQLDTQLSGSLNTTPLQQTPLQFLETTRHHYEWKEAPLKNNIAYFVGLKSIRPIISTYATAVNNSKIIDTLLNESTIDSSTMEAVPGGGRRMTSLGQGFTTKTITTHAQFQTVQLATIQSDWDTLLTRDQILLRDTSHIRPLSNTRMGEYRGGIIDPRGGRLLSMSRIKAGAYDENDPYDEEGSYDDQGSDVIVGGEYGVATKPGTSVFPEAVAGTYDGDGGHTIFENGFDVESGTSGRAVGVGGFGVVTGRHVDPLYQVRTDDPFSGVGYQRISVGFNDSSTSTSSLGLRMVHGSTSEQTVEEGESVTMAFRARGVVDPDVDLVRFSLQVLDSTGTVVGTYNLGLQDVLTDNWTRYSLTTSVPANSFYLRVNVFIEKNTAGTAGPTRLDIDQMQVYTGEYGDSYDALDAYDSVPAYRIRLSAAARVYLPESNGGVYELRIRNNTGTVLARKSFTLPARTWVEIFLPYVTDTFAKDFTAEVVQTNTGTSEVFVVSMLGLFYNPFVWEVSNDDGATWTTVVQGINNPHCSTTLPALGRELKVRCQGSKVGAIASGFQIVPWFISGPESIRSTIYADDTVIEETSGEGPLFGPLFKQWARAIPQEYSLSTTPY